MHGASPVHAQLLLNSNSICIFADVKVWFVGLTHRGLPPWYQPATTEPPTTYHHPITNNQISFSYGRKRKQKFLTIMD